MSLFAGMANAHGTYKVDDGVAPDGSKKKGKALTVRQPVTSALWQSHLDGERGIGIIPIREDNMCRWGAIDVDIYNLDIVGLVKRITDAGLPLVVCRSKSGGAHAMAFTKEPVQASMMQVKLRELAAGLGYGKSEIFPKQGTVLVDKGDMGNWLNMPYFGGANTTRYAFGPEGTSLSPDEFLAYATSKAMTPEEFETLALAPQKTKVSKKAAGSKVDTNHPLFGAPPCLQNMAEQGVPEGNRNNALYNYAVYAKKRHPDDWEAAVDQYNLDYMDEPLGSAEVELIKKGMLKKDYNYKCNDQPICGFCNAALCRTRKYGVGVSGSTPIFNSLSKLNTNPALWFLDVEGQRMELTTDQLYNQSLFQKACMDNLTAIPPRVKDNQWHSVLHDLMENAVLIEAPREVSRDGQLEELIEDFVRGSNILALSRDDILFGKPWSDGGKVYFRIKDLMDQLTRNNFKDCTRTQVIARITAMGGDKDFFKLKGRGVNVWWVPEVADQDSPFDLPEELNDEAPF